MNNIQIKLNELRSLNFEESYKKFQEFLDSQYNIAIDDSVKMTERIMVVIECDDKID